MRLPRLSAGVIRDSFTVIGRGVGGLAPQGVVPVCGDPCQGADSDRSEACPTECPCTEVNGAWTCYKA